jgi:hypothetical protein
MISLTLMDWAATFFVCALSFLKKVEGSALRGRPVQQLAGGESDAAPLTLLPQEYQHPY